MVRAADERANLALQNGHLLGAVEATHLEGVPRHTAGRRLARIRRVDLRCAAAASLPPALRRGLELVGVAVFCFCVTARVRRTAGRNVRVRQVALLGPDDRDSPGTGGL